jgi:hypothetical protein
VISLPLIGWYRLNGDALDSSGNGNHGTVTGSGNWVAGKTGDAREFTADNSQIAIPHNELLSKRIFGTATRFSISVWFYPVSFENHGVLVAKATSGSYSNTTAGIWAEASGVAAIMGTNEGSNPSGSSIILRYVPTLNEWHHIVAVADGTHLRLYVDRVLRGSALISGMTRTRSENTAQITIGPRSAGANTSKVRGSVCDLRLYDHDLSMKEIVELSKAKVMHMTFDQVDDVTDSSGFSRDGTNAGAVWTPDAQVGKGAFEFSSADTYINLSNDIGYRDEVSAFAWFKANGNGGGSYHIIFGGQHLEISISNAGALRTGVYTSARYLQDNGSGVNDGNWHHIGFTYANGTKIAYIDGLPVGTQSSIPGSLTYAFANRRIGRYGTSPTYWANGIIDDPVIFGRALSADEVLALYQNRASLDSKGNLHVPAIMEIKQPPMLLDYTIWQDGQTGSVGVFSQNGSTAENHRVLGPDPWGKETVLWEARPDATSGADGGWNQTTIAVDNTKMYRFSTWVRRTVIGNGSFYLGCNGYGSTNGVIRVSTGANDTNPYFWVGALSNTDWILVVAHVWPHTYAGTTFHPDSGRYTLAGVKFGNVGYDFKWRPETTTGRHRSYLYYSTDTDTRQQWVYPRLDLCDGTEPSLSELLSGHDSRIVDHIRAKGGTAKIGLDIGSKLTVVNRFSEVGPTEGLKAWYPFKYDANDLTENALNGTVFGATAYLDTERQAYNFSGGNHYIDLPFGNGEDPTSTPRTYTMWVRVPSASGDVMCFSAPVGSNQRLYIGKNSSKWDIGIQASPWATGTPSAAVAANQWTFVVLTMDGSTANLYADNVLSISKAYTSYTLSGDFKLGYLSGSIYWWEGQIGETRIYDRVLSLAELGILRDTTGPSAERMKRADDGTVYTKGSLREV